MPDDMIYNCNMTSSKITFTLALNNFKCFVESSEDKTSPVTIQLKNESYGADEYEWTFSSSSNQRDSGTRTI